LALVLAAAIAGLVVASSPPSAEAPRAAAASGTFVEFAASDGFTFSNSLEVHRDGRASLVCSSRAGRRLRPIAVRTSFRLSPRQLRSLRRLLDAARFPTLADEYVPESRGADLPSYWISYGGKRVYVDGFAIGAGIVPARLRRVVRLLDRIVEPEARTALTRARG
jgi:hypothetical protein